MCVWPGRLFSDGVWCPLDDDDSGQLVVRSAQQTGVASCYAMRWDASRRLVVKADDSDAAQPLDELAFADLGDGLLLMQYEEQKHEDSGEPKLFILMAGMVHGEAFAILPLPGDEGVVAQAAHYPGIAFATRHIAFMTPSLPPDAPEGAQPPPSPHHYISDGDPADIRSLSRDLVIGMLRKVVAEAEGEKPLPDHGVFVPVLIRAERGPPDHPPTPHQQRDLAALMDRLLALADR